MPIDDPSDGWRRDGPETRQLQVSVPSLAGSPLFPGTAASPLGVGYK